MKKLTNGLRVIVLAALLALSLGATASQAFAADIQPSQDGIFVQGGGGTPLTHKPVRGLGATWE
jgi:hypothetical protein